MSPLRAVTTPTESILLTSSYVNVPPIETLPENVPSTPLTLPENVPLTPLTLPVATLLPVTLMPVFVVSSFLAAS